MARKSKFFRVATEGATTDGRKIERKWLQEIAATYNPVTYGARIFIEHIRGINPNAQGAFRAMGDVTAVKIEEIDGKISLFAQIDPTEELIALVGQRQKIYSSIEVAENFANTGMAYLVGMGVTDSPASLSTEILAFAAQNPTANPFASRKQAPDNLFTAAEEIAIELEDEEPEPAVPLLDRIRALFTRKGADDAQRFADVHASVEHVAQAAADNATAVEQLREDYSALSAQLAANKTASDQALTQAIADITAKIDHTEHPGTPTRPTAPGGSGELRTDC
ncbi:GPO family capsid scaffolding protein [Lysobacter sp. TAF61]|uniref:GPO family capsid scaffolding protein n=1 Tax=Lysobacter sp. TAF61 TaxID=3233072 RepID=UPI003F9D791E